MADRRILNEGDVRQLAVEKYGMSEDGVHVLPASANSLRPGAAVWEVRWHKEAQSGQIRRPELSEGIHTQSPTSIRLTEYGDLLTERRVFTGKTYSSVPWVCAGEPCLIPGEIRCFFNAEGQGAIRSIQHTEVGYKALVSNPDYLVEGEALTPEAARQPSFVRFEVDPTSGLYVLKKEYPNRLIQDGPCQMTFHPDGSVNEAQRRMYQAEVDDNLGAHSPAQTSVYGFGERFTLANGEAAGDSGPFRPMRERNSKTPIARPEQGPLLHIAEAVQTQFANLTGSMGAFLVSQLAEARAAWREGRYSEWVARMQSSMVTSVLPETVAATHDVRRTTDIDPRVPPLR